MVDAISDMLTRIRNAQAVGHEIAKVPYSNFKWEVAELMQKKGYIAEAEKKGRNPRRVIEITLKYEKDMSPFIRELRRISKPGRRFYVKRTDLMSRRAGRRRVVSTPKGIMLDQDARKAGVGGEILFEIWA